MRLTVAWVVATLLLPYVAAQSLPADAQTASKLYRIGVITHISIRDSEYVRSSDVFFGALREVGYAEGKNIVMERRSSDGHAERFPELAAELVGLKVDLIVVFTTPAALAAKAATSTIPILIVGAHDPCGSRARREFGAAWRKRYRSSDSGSGARCEAPGTSQGIRPARVACRGALECRQSRKRAGAPTHRRCSTPLGNRAATSRGSSA